MKGIYGYWNTETYTYDYIGKDSHIDEHKRHKQHLKPSNYDDQVINMVLQNHMDKYDYHVIVQGDFTDEELNILEIRYIKRYDTFNRKDGFNFTIGGDGLGSGENHPMYRDDLDVSIFVHEYFNNKLNTCQIADKYDTHHETVRRRLKEAGYELRAGRNYRADVDTNILAEEYFNNNLTSKEIGKKYDINPNTVNRRLKEAGYKLRAGRNYRDDLDINILADEYFNNNLSLKEIGDKYNTNASTVHSHLRKAGYELRKKGGYRDDLDDNIIVDMYVNQHISSTEISKKLNASETTITRRLRNNGIKIRDRSERNSGKNNPTYRDDLDVNVFVDEYFNNNLSLREIGKKYNTSSSTVKYRLEKAGYELRDGHRYRCDLDINILADEYFNNNLSLKKIGEKYNTSATTIGNYLKNAGYELRKAGGNSNYRIDLDINILTDEYFNNNLTLKEIGKKYNISDTTVKNRLKDAGYELRTTMNTSGYYRVTKNKAPRCKQGFFYRYSYDDNGKKKSICSVDIKELEKKVKAKGLTWKKL